MTDFSPRLDDWDSRPMRDRSTAHSSARRVERARRRPATGSRIGGALRSLIGWFRAGYPDEAPAMGYSALLALNGPIALTPKQIEQILGSLNGKPARVADIEVAITKATDHLPTAAQVRAVVRLLSVDARFPDSY
jgi:hypothetical protein